MIVYLFDQQVFGNWWLLLSPKSAYLSTPENGPLRFYLIKKQAEWDSDVIVVLGPFERKKAFFSQIIPNGIIPISIIPLGKKCGE
jgi:hypothetical protein